MNARLSGSSEAAFFLDAAPAPRVDNRAPPVASAPTSAHACQSWVLSAWLSPDGEGKRRHTAGHFRGVVSVTQKVPRPRLRAARGSVKVESARITKSSARTRLPGDRWVSALNLDLGSALVNRGAPDLCGTSSLEAS